MNYDSARRKILRKQFPYGVLYPFFWFASQLFCMASFVRAGVFASGIIGRYRASVPVVSVGNIVAGGTGKTSMCHTIYEDMESVGFLPFIVMRGYKGRIRGPEVAKADPVAFGDEASMHALEGYRTIVSRDRIRGLEYAVELGATLCILDDGFQHLRVKPTVNIVLVDLFNPFGDSHCLPLGTLREPLVSLKRADCFILTRTNLVSADRLEEVESYLRVFSKPVFYARQEFKRWVDQDYRRVGPPDKNINVFCGIGNPDQFVKMLIELGFKIDNIFVFNDHHEYTEEDIGMLKSFANLVTTEKDMVKLRNSGLKFKVPLVKFEVDGLKSFIIEKIRNVEKSEDAGFEKSFAPDGISFFESGE